MFTRKDACCKDSTQDGVHEVNIYLFPVCRFARAVYAVATLKIEVILVAS